MRPTLRYGSRGPDVADLQREFDRLPSRLPRLQPDGIYGAKTTGRVRELQSGHGLVSDGVTGPMTWKLLGELLAALRPGAIPSEPTHTVGSPGVAAVDPQRTRVLNLDPAVTV